MKKILVVDVAAEHSGGAAILKEFFDYICSCEQKYEWLFLVSVVQLEVPQQCQEYVSVIYRTEMKRSLFHRLKWEMKNLKEVIGDFVPDLVFSLQNLVVRYAGVTQVIYMHQSLPFQDAINFSFFKKSERVSAFQQHVMGFLIKRSIKKADKVIVQTPWVKESVTRMTGVDKEKVLVIPPCVKSVAISEQSSDYEYIFESGKTVIFYPALALPYKNHMCLLEAQEKMKKKNIDVKVVLTVNRNDSNAVEIVEYISKNQLDTELLGYLNKSDLLYIMRHAILVFPSLIETVGLPLIEAQMCDTYIVAANYAYAYDVCSEYEHISFFDPLNSDDLVEKIEVVLQKEEKRTRNVNVAVPEKYQPQHTWGQVLECFDTMLND